jgi:DNA-binding beta-propeller fold protein YncE
MRRRELLELGAGAAVALLVPAGEALGRRARARARPLALVTADLESRLVAVDLAGGEIVAHVPTPAGPRSIELVGRGGTALVAHTAAGLVSVVDTASLRVRRVLEGFSEPRYTAGAPHGRHAFVTDAALGQLVSVDLGRGRVSARVEVGAYARHVTIDPAGTTVWAALGPKAPAIAEIDVSDPARLRLRRRVAPLDLAHDVVFDPDGAHVWVTSGADQRVAVHDARTRRPVLVLPAGAPPQHAVLLAGAAFVTSGDDGTLRMHRLADGALLRETRVAAGSYNVSAGGGRVFTPSLDVGSLCIADERARLVGRETVARSAHDACFARS